MKQISILLLSLLLLAGCSAAGQGTPPAVPSESQGDPAVTVTPSEHSTPASNTPDTSATPVEPVICNGFGQLNWGGDYQELFSGDTVPEDACLPDEFAGFPCDAHYMFREGTGLTGGWYQFNMDSFDEGTQVYQAARAELVRLYGEPSTPTQSPRTEPDEHGNPPLYFNIEDLIAAGDGTCIEQWGFGRITNEQEEFISLSIQITARNEVLVAYINHSKMMSTD